MIDSIENGVLLRALMSLARETLQLYGLHPNVRLSNLLFRDDCRFMNPNVDAFQRAVHAGTRDAYTPM